MKKFTFPLFLIFLFALSAFAQKVREKKDIIYVDDVAQYKFLKTAGKGIAELKSWVVLSMKDDTLVWLKAKEQKLPKLAFEMGAKSFYYFEMSFAGSDLKVAHSYEAMSVGINLGAEMVKAGVLQSGGLNPGALPKYQEAMYEQEEKRKDFEKIITRREQLLKNPAYAEYQKGCKDRSPGDTLSVARGVIAFVDVFGERKTIGAYKTKSQNEYGITFDVFKDDKSPVGTITIGSTNKVTIRTLFDNQTEEYPSPTRTVEIALPEAIRYLTNNGYL